MKVRNCIICEKEIIGRSNSAKTCSIICSTLARRKHYKENREKFCEQRRKYRAKNLEKYRKHSRDSYARNRRYYETNREKIRERERKYYAKRKELIQLAKRVLEETGVKI